jgi:hypothetical protein
LSTTTSVNEHVAERPEESRASYEIGVEPRLKAPPRAMPDVRLTLAIRQLSLAVGRLYEILAEHNPRSVGTGPDTEGQAEMH